MKRLLVSALILSLATAVRSLPADDQPAPGPAPNTAPQVQQPNLPPQNQNPNPPQQPQQLPQQNLAPSQPPANGGQQSMQPQQIAPAPSGINPNSLGNASAPNAVIENGASRGALAGLVSGAPSVATTAPANIAPQMAPSVNNPPAATTVVGTQTTVVQSQMTAVPKPASIFEQCDLIARTRLHCLTRSPREIKLNAQPRMVRMGGFFPFPPLPVGDLELLGLQQVGEAPDAGPIYRITFRNNSPVAAQNFRVSLIGALGRVEFESAIVSLDVDEVAAKSTTSVELTLPASALTLGPAGKQQPFDTVVVAIDSFDELMETDEMNNIASFKRGEIVVIETTTTVSPAPAGVPAPAAGPPAGGTSELDRIDLDKVSSAGGLFSR